MADLTIWVLGDGPNEIAREWDHLLESGQLPALPRLVHRLLGEPARAKYELRLFRRIEHVRGKGDVWRKKAEAAIALARERGFDALVIVIDRDRQSRGGKCRPVSDGRDGMAHLGYPPCAVGCAIETFDAWMIADGSAVGAADGDAARSHPDPESLDQEEGTGRHPKDRAIELFGSAGALTAAYAQVAAHVDLNLLEKLCPRGFAPFAAEVWERIGPVVREESGA